IEEARQKSIEEARAEYDARIEEERVRRASDFSDTILFGDSIMQNSQGALYAEMPGVTINAMGGRALEIGPIGAGSDPSDGVLDHIRADTGGYSRYVIGTGNNDAGGMSLAAGEEIVAHIGPDKEIFFVTEYVGGNLGGTAATNATIADLAARYDNVHAIGWYELVSSSPGTYLSDGCHPLASAMPAYASLIREAICNVDAKPFDPESVPFDPSSVEFDESTVEFDPSSVDFGESEEGTKPAEDPPAEDGAEGGDEPR
ncbi:MAG: hypothetical protein IJ131_06870, partial [Eggerthellaceae bacterium]|nr:hypothetical protein [Eggerthellaceae bacterium]